MYSPKDFTGESYVTLSSLLLIPSALYIDRYVPQPHNSSNSSLSLSLSLSLSFLCVVRRDFGRLKL
jgi:hypothetical protein